MPDQIFDKRTVGIPSDIEAVRADVNAFKKEAESSAKAAQQSAEEALESQKGAAAYAEAAKDIVDAQTGIHFAVDEPLAGMRTNGMLWLVPDEGSGTITSLKRWDGTAIGGAAYPSDTTYPSDGLYPSPRGEWKDYKFGAGCIA